LSGHDSNWYRRSPNPVLTSSYLTGAPLLETLVRGKFDARGRRSGAEGWAWVEAVPQMSHADRQTFQNAPRQRREPSAREARRIASLQGRLDKIGTTLEEAYDAEGRDGNAGRTARAGGQ
jgi:ParB family transcriptional regulator, chromosome partitioning protein